MTRLFFATDIHGSEQCFFKFLNSAKFYKVDVLILNGDLTGKMAVPIVKQPDGSYKANFMGLNRVLRGEEELAEFETRVRFVGYYPYRTDIKEMSALSSDARRVDDLFSHLMVERLKRWVRLAEERLHGTALKLYVMGGNDDNLVIDEVLRNSDRIINPDGVVIRVDSAHEMVSCSWISPTPWRTARECSEEELLSKLKAMILSVKDLGGCIFNLHAPPVDSGLDTCQRLDENLKPVFLGGHPVVFGAGSTAVRTVIERYQPMLGLHGHIHESRGVIKIGRTLCLNPGSEYTEGILRGIIVDLDEKGVRSYLFTSG